MTDTRRLISETDLPEHEAVRLLAVATHETMTDVRLGFAIENPRTVETYSTLVDRRRAGEPLQYIEGSVPFGGAVIAVDARVLIPRPETEEILDIVDALVDQPHSIVDLCTGSGALAIALALRYPAAEVHATDVDPLAIECARSNASSNGVSLRFHRGDVFDALPPDLEGSIDLLVGNPPYLTPGEYEEVAPDVTREPRHALVSGPTGSEFVDRIGSEASRWLAPGGLIVCEISEFRSAEAVAAFTGLEGVVRNDLWGAPRFVVGRRPFE